MYVLEMNSEQKKQTVNSIDVADILHMYKFHLPTEFFWQTPVAVCIGDVGVNSGTSSVQGLDRRRRQRVRLYCGPDAGSSQNL